MAIAVGPSSEDDVMSQINTTPLVDVMLVLLIIFLITVPVVTTSVPVRLPKERVDVRETEPENIVISVDAQGAIYWHDAKMPDAEALLARLKAAARRTPQPQVHVRGDSASRYEGVGRVLLACQQAGIAKVAFVTEPPPLGG
jgi:biopolymer transport protein ExbD